MPEEKWAFYFMGGLIVQLTGEQKESVVKQMASFLSRDNMVGLIQLSADDGSAFGFRSDSVVVWVKMMPQDPPDPITENARKIVRAG